MKIRLIGDVHEHVERYDIMITKNISHSVQLGDMGFKKEYNYLKHHVSPVEHKFIPGNHDDYDHLPKHALGNFGVYQPANVPPLKTKIFYIRGALSVDKHYREVGVSYWTNEELSYAQGNDCCDLYRKIKPDIVLSHDCPTELLGKFITNDMKVNASRTNNILQICFDYHRPKRWFFGHHHQTKSIIYAGTTFSCLNELDFYDLEVE